MVADDNNNNDQILGMLREFRGEFNEYKRNMERRVGGIEKQSSEILKNQKEFATNCSRTTQKFSDLAESEIKVRDAIKENLEIRMDRIEARQNELEKDQKNQQKGATNRERWAIFGSYISQIIIEVLRFIRSL